MKIITISASHSGLGKTALVEKLLKKLKGWSALKVTVLHKGMCPTGRNCGVCNNLSSQFLISGENDIIDEKGKDTQRFKKAGAKQVLWLRTKPGSLKKGLEEAISKFSAKTMGIIVEGTSIIKYLKPDLAIFLNDNKTVLRAVAKLAYTKSDIIINVDR